MCALGQDIEELYQPDPERLFKFWTTLQDMFITLYGLLLPKNEPERGGATDEATPLPRATSVTASTGSSIAATPLARPPAFIDTPFPSRKEYDAWVAAGSFTGL